MNTLAVVEYPCGCRWAFPPQADHLPRNCPDHWPADKGYRLENDTPQDHARAEHLREAREVEDHQEAKHAARDTKGSGIT